MMMLTQRRLKLLIWITVLIVILGSIYLYWLYQEYYPSTDNAYVGANVVQIAPQVTGPILKIYVNNFDTVKKGQPLFDIDPATFKASYEKARAQLVIAKQNFNALKREVLVAQALVEQKESELKLAQQNFDRIHQLVKVRQIALAEGDKATRDIKVANAGLIEAKSRLQQAIEKLGDPNSENNAEIDEAEAELLKAQLNLNYTHVISPTNGYIVNLTAREGAIINASTPLFSIVDGSQWWVDANFKETELEHIRPLQLANVVVDIYPNHKFKGYVKDISRGSGTAFSIFPAENATGNWVKVSQRFPVRIYLINPDPKFPLRIGASATVSIDTFEYFKAPVTMKGVKYQH